MDTNVGPEALSAISNLAVVLEDISGSGEVQHTVDDQFTIAGQLTALPLEKS